MNFTADSQVRTPPVVACPDEHVDQPEVGIELPAEYTAAHVDHSTSNMPSAETAVHVIPPLPNCSNHVVEQPNAVHTSMATSPMPLQAHTLGVNSTRVNSTTQQGAESNSIDDLTFVEFVTGKPTAPLLTSPPEINNIDNQCTDRAILAYPPSTQRTSSRLAEKKKANPTTGSVQMAQRVLMLKLGE